MNLKDINEKLKNIKKEDVNSFLIAVLLMAGLISFIINIKNIIPIIILTVLVIIEITNYKETIQKIKKKEALIPNTVIIFFLLIAILYVFSFITHGIKYVIVDRCLHFVGFLVIPCVCCRHEFNVKKVIDSILIISTILTIPLFFDNFEKYDGGTRMSISYYMLPTYISMIMSFFIDDDKSMKKIVKKLIYFLIVLYPYNLFLIKHASRGIYVAIITCISLSVIVKRNLKEKIIIISIIGIIITLGILFFRPLLTITNDILTSANITVEAISKSLKLYNEGQLGNGRDLVYNRAIEGIKEHPILGNGIGSYAEKYVTYPHNLLLQMWYEGGILFFILTLGIIIYSIYVLVFEKHVNVEKKYILILLTSISIVRLMISYEFWKEISFGIYIYVILNIMQNEIDRRKNGKCNNSNI